MTKKEFLKTINELESYDLTGIFTCSWFHLYCNYKLSKRYREFIKCWLFNKYICTELISVQGSCFYTQKMITRELIISAFKYEMLITKEYLKI